MNKEELIGKLQMTYVGDRNAFNELVGYYDGLKQGIEELQQENKELKEFTNKVKQAFEYMRNCDPYEWESCRAYNIAYEMVFGDSNE